MERLEIKAASPELAVETLSGGNQQKVALARVLHQRADVLLLDEPTRGIDVGTKATIYRLIGELAAAGQGHPVRELVFSGAAARVRPDRRHVARPIARNSTRRRVDRGIAVIASHRERLNA